MGKERGGEGGWVGGLSRWALSPFASSLSVSVCLFVGLSIEGEVGGEKKVSLCLLACFCLLLSYSVSLSLSLLWCAVVVVVVVSLFLNKRGRGLLGLLLSVSMNKGFSYTDRSHSLARSLSSFLALLSQVSGCGPLPPPSPSPPPLQRMSTSPPSCDNVTTLSSKVTVTTTSRGKTSFLAI